jgi:hypothetical protein
MKHAKPTRAWRPVRAQGGKRRPLGLFGALAFNLCLLLLPVASATALIIIARDRLYAYEASEAGARVVSARVERLNGELIQLDFDRQRQWDDLVAMELMSEDVSAARGFLLSARGMLPGRALSQLNRRLPAGAGDAEIELAALELLTPGTRARYEATVPLLSRRAASGAAQPRLAPAPTLANPQDFELMARALLAQPETDALQFVLTGFSLGFAGELSPRAARGAAALLDASRRDDYPLGLEADINALLAAAAPLEAFRNAAVASASGEDAGGLANASAAFRASVNSQGAATARAVLDDIGAMSEATSHEAAVALLTHAANLRDLPKLRLVAQASGDRAAAAAKRLQRDGRLLRAARGELTITRELAAAIGVAALALLGLLFIVLFKAFHAGRAFWMRFRDDDYAAELVEISAKNWRPL